MHIPSTMSFMQHILTIDSYPIWGTVLEAKGICCRDV